MKKTFLFLSFALLTLGSCSSDDDNVSNPQIPTAAFSVSVGGPNQPNQLYLDLSTKGTKSVNRTAWDFGFSSGADFRVIINGSLKMAVKQLETSDITLPQVSNSDVSVGGGTNLSSNGYVDNPTGILVGAGAGKGTAIAEVSATDADNKVYLVNLGLAVSTNTPGVGSVEVDGVARGWKKVRILRNGNGYKIQYADLASTTFTEKTIAKDADFNFSFFSLTSGSTVSVEPQKAKWDLNFTTFVNYIPSEDADKKPIEVTYGYSDYIVSNMKGGTKVYQVLVADGGSYADFTKAKVVEGKFTVSVTDQRVIGSSWRAGGSPGTLPSIRTDRFYVVKNAAGDYYKVRFLGLTDAAGVRGHATAEFEILK
jgi:hypothetical protein